MWQNEIEIHMCTFVLDLRHLEEMDHTEKAAKAGARSTQLGGRRHGNEKLQLPQHQTNGETFVSALEQKESLKEREGEGEGISKKVTERDIELKAFFQTLQAARKGVLQSLKSHKAAIEMFLPALLAALAPIDRTQSRKLLKRLSTMVQQGAPPSFAGAAILHESALSLQHTSAWVEFAFLLFADMQTQAQGRAISVDEWSIALLKSVPCVCVCVCCWSCVYMQQNN